MKLNEVYPITVVALRAWPNSGLKAHSAISQQNVNSFKQVKAPKSSKKRNFGESFLK